MSEYLELKKRQQQIINSLPLHWAFGNDQFQSAMQKLGLDPENDKDKIRAGPGGSFVLVKDYDRIKNAFLDLSSEREEAIQADTTGDGFIYQMFLQELADHEYSYTGDAADTLDALGYEWDEVNADPRLKNGFEKACAAIQGSAGW